MEAGREALLHAGKPDLVEFWMDGARTLTLKQAHQFAKELGFVFDFNWEEARTTEGYYQIENSVEFAALRSIQMGNISDIQLMHTLTPSFAEAKVFADLIHSVNPKSKLAYSCLPSFNFKEHFASELEISQFSQNLASLGFCLQITKKASDEYNKVVSDIFTQKFREEGIGAFLSLAKEGMAT